jgi:gluconate 2-dehydrogenase gamma chain
MVESCHDSGSPFSNPDYNAGVQVKQESISRRAFLKSGADTARGSFIVMTLPMILTACREAEQARVNGAGFQTLNENEVLEFDAIAARIIPSDGTPGAREAGVIYFMDNVLGDNREAELQMLRDGVRELQAEVVATFGVAYFHLLDEAQQDRMLSRIENTPFFGSMRMLTVAGMFSLPEYGGNRDLVGYQLIGFEDRHVWLAPFGFYDADYRENGA